MHVAKLVQVLAKKTSKMITGSFCRRCWHQLQVFLQCGRYRVLIYYQSQKSLAPSSNFSAVRKHYVKFDAYDEDLFPNFCSFNNLGTTEQQSLARNKLQFGKLSDFRHISETMESRKKTILPSTRPRLEASVSKRFTQNYESETFSHTFSTRIEPIVFWKLIKNNYLGRFYKL